MSSGCTVHPPQGYRSSTSGAPVRPQVRVNLDVEGGRVVSRQDACLAALARQLVHAGHAVCVIDLDRSKHRHTSLDLLLHVLGTSGVELWVGGGLQDPAHARALLDAGAAGVLLGAGFLAGCRSDPELVGALFSACPAPRVMVSIDALDDHLVQRGFTELTTQDAALTRQRLLPTLPAGTGVVHVAVAPTRSGSGTDPDAATRARHDHPHLSHWYAGNVSSWADVAALDAAGVGAVLGRRFLSGELGLPPDLPERSATT